MSHENIVSSIKRTYIMGDEGDGVEFLKLYTKIVGTSQKLQETHIERFALHFNQNTFTRIHQQRHTLHLEIVCAYIWLVTFHIPLEQLEHIRHPDALWEPRRVRPRALWAHVFNSAPSSPFSQAWVLSVHTPTHLHLASSNFN